MRPKRRSLGRGLEALLGSDPIAPQPSPAGRSPGIACRPPRTGPVPAAGGHAPGVAAGTGRLHPRPGPGAADHRTPAFSPSEDGAETRYEIVAGERRWRAAQLAGLDVIPALVRDLSNREAVAVGLIENMQREDLNPLEEAGALRRLVNEFEMTHAEAAGAVGRSRGDRDQPDAVAGVARRGQGNWSRPGR